MKRLFLILLVFVMMLSACSLPVNQTSPSITGGTTYNPDLDLGFSKSESYDQLIQLYLDAQANRQYSYGFAKNAAEDTSSAQPSSGDSRQGTSDGSYSTTNIQVEGVDEADIIKTDGSYLYLIANNRMYIVDVTDPGSMDIVSTYRLYENRETGDKASGETPLEMFVDPINNRLVLISSGWMSEKTEGDVPEVRNEFSTDSDVADMREAAPYYYYSYKQFTTTRIFDISSRSAPKLERQFSQTGYYLDSRKIGLSLYVITNEYGGYYGPARDLVNSTADHIDPADIFPATCSKIGSADPDDFETIPADRISILPEGDVESKLIVAGIDVINNSREPELLAVLGTSGTVFCSQNYLYVASYNYPWLWAVLEDSSDSDSETKADEEASTDIFRFKLADTTISEAGKGNVPGWIVNQFSMDEYDGFFRIATTTGSTWARSEEDKALNNVFVLDSQMEIIGRVTGLAPGESIKSVRFMGETAYVVTFRDVDPLFVIDLTVPAKPVVLGQLKIPGYSTYLHPYRDNQLIGFGYDVVSSGDNAYNNGVKVSLFDVSDFNNPVETSTMVFGGRGSYSSLLYDHKALLFSEDMDLFAFPASLTEQTNSSLSYGQPVFTGLLSLSIKNGQFVLDGSVTHFDKLPDPYGSYEPLTNAEYNAFYSYDAIFRAAYIGNTLFTVSNREIRSSTLDTFTLVGSVNLPGVETYDSKFEEEITDVKPEPEVMPEVTGSAQAPDATVEMTGEDDES